MASSRYKIERMPDGIAVSARVVHDSHAWRKLGRCKKRIRLKK